MTQAATPAPTVTPNGLNVKVLSDVMASYPQFKPQSLYDMFVKAVKKGPLKGKAFPVKGNSEGSKFEIPKARVSNDSLSETREVINFIILDPDAFDAWIEKNKDKIRSAVSESKLGSVMPTIADVMAGKYSSEQLESIAKSVANTRYNRKRKPKTETETPTPAKAASKTASKATKKPAKPVKAKKTVVEEDDFDDEDED